MRIRWKIAAGAAALPLLWLAAERLGGPSAAPLPATLPYIVRRPPPAPLTRLTTTAPPAYPTPGDRALHARGITGRGLGIAIIDQFLLTDHREYASRLRWYDEIDGRSADPAGFHACGVASVAAGANCGVAPEADLYFVGLGAIWKSEPLGNWFVAARRAAHTGMGRAMAIRRILELNRRLDPRRGIRAISISVGFRSRLYGLDDAADAIAEAERAGMFVSSAFLDLPALGPVRAASPAGPGRYAVYGPAVSWAIPYWAGRYLLACQQDPSMTPARFRATLRPRR